MAFNMYDTLSPNQPLIFAKRFYLCKFVQMDKHAFRQHAFNKKGKALPVTALFFVVQRYTQCCGICKCFLFTCFEE